MFRILSGFEQNSNRQSLDDLDVVSGCILGGQQAVAIATRTGHVFDVTAVVSAEGIDVDRDPFVMMHSGKLRFLEIRRDPNVLQRDN